MDDHKRIDGKTIEHPANCIDIHPDAGHLVIGSNRGDLYVYDPSNFDNDKKYVDKNEL